MEPPEETRGHSIIQWRLVCCTLLRSRQQERSAAIQVFEKRGRERRQQRGLAEQEVEVARFSNTHFPAAAIQGDEDLEVAQVVRVGNLAGLTALVDSDFRTLVFSSPGNVNRLPLPYSLQSQSYPTKSTLGNIRPVLVNLRCTCSLPHGELLFRKHRNVLY